MSMAIPIVAPKKERKKKMAHSAQKYESFEAFVQVKVDQANELLSRMDQDELYKILNLKK
jgi:hypothetical protein